MITDYIKYDPADADTHPREGSPVLCLVYDDAIGEYGIHSGYAVTDFLKLWDSYINGGCSIFWSEIDFPVKEAK
jgi:hypothetical protein